MSDYMLGINSILALNSSWVLAQKLQTVVTDCSPNGCGMEIS